MARTKAKPSTSANEDIDEYPDLDFASNEEEDYDTAMRKKVFFEPINTDTTKVSRSVNFTCSPPVVHFSGFQTNEWMEQDIKVINISKHSQRLCVLLPETDFFTVCTTASHTHTHTHTHIHIYIHFYHPLSTVTLQSLSYVSYISLDFQAIFNKSGVLAPGMSQKVTIKFRAQEYKYYYDSLRIQGDIENLLIPIHAYPVINKVDFPKQISFGNAPLAEPAHKVNSMCMTCNISIPV